MANLRWTPPPGEAGPCTATLSREWRGGSGGRWWYTLTLGYQQDWLDPHRTVATSPAGLYRVARELLPAHVPITRTFPLVARRPNEVV